jgi:activating signal cointegrator complex subunit 3
MHDDDNDDDDIDDDDVCLVLSLTSGCFVVQTIVAELAILRMKARQKDGICVYIAPLKSLARERLKEWKIRLSRKPLEWTILELTGDTHHDQQALASADILVCTPEKWDLISRGWNSSTALSQSSSYSIDRSYVKRVQLLVLDEVHLLGEQRGAVLEAIVSRTRYISEIAKKADKTRTSAADGKSDGANGGGEAVGDKTRILALSTAIANPLDLADWIGIDVQDDSSVYRGLYNFPAASRPVPMSVHVQVSTAM